MEKVYAIPDTKENRSKCDWDYSINGILFESTYGDNKPPTENAMDIGELKWNTCSFSDIVGQKILAIHGCEVNSEDIWIVTNRYVYRMYHEQDCCETVLVDDVVGDINDIIGEHVVRAEEVTNTTDPPAASCDDTYLWTFYKLATRKGYLDIKWFGTSNGYYSEEVTVQKTYNEKFSKFLLPSCEIK